MRYAKDQKEQTRARILAAATRLLLHRGFEGAGIEPIMAAAKLTRGGFYGHFASKEALESATLSRIMEVTRARLFAAAPAERSGGALRNIVDAYLSETHRDHVEEGCALPTLSADVARRTPDTRKTYEAELLLVVAELEARVDDDDGEMPSFDRALALVALLAGGVALARAVRNKALSARILAACRRFALR